MRRGLFAAVSASAVAWTSLAASAQQAERLRDDLASVAVDRVNRAVADELAEPRYRLDPSWYEWLEDFLARMWIRLLELASALADYVGGPLVLGLLIGGLVIGAAVVITANLGRRRARVVDERLRREHEAARGIDPVLLDRQADEASRAGEHEAAFRLAFRAGLVRLDREGRIDLRPGTTSGTLVDTIDDPAFTRLADRFDGVVYGSDDPVPADLETTRSVMAGLLEAVRA